MVNRSKKERRNSKLTKRPSPQEIFKMLEEIRNEHYPILQIGNVEIKISERLKTTAGHVQCYKHCGTATNFLMTISGPYHDHFGWGSELYETLKHEIIHIARPYAKHGESFYTEMHRTGAERFARTRGRDLTMKAQYRCKACSHTWKSTNREQFCPICDDLIEQIGIIEE
jgi:rubrerythrin